MTKNTLSLYQMKVFLTTKCSLRCTHCLNSNTDVPRIVASVDNVKKQIDFARSMGVERIELGVLVGDSFEYPVNDLKQIVDYLETLADVEYVSISSSLQFLSPAHIDIINSTNKLKIQLSWYGKNDDEYKDITGFKRGFTRLLDNVALLRNVTSNVQLTVISMFSEKTSDSDLITLLDSIAEDTSITVVYDDEAPVTNWNNMLSEIKIVDYTKPRRGACDYLFADMGIDEEGNVLSCAWFDYAKLVKLGNIHTCTPQQILDNHYKIVRQQEIGVFTGPCRNCTVYSCSSKKMD